MRLFFRLLSQEPFAVPWNSLVLRCPQVGRAQDHSVNSSIYSRSRGRPGPHPSLAAGPMLADPVAQLWGSIISFQNSSFSSCTASAIFTAPGSRWPGTCRATFAGAVAVEACGSSGQLGLCSRLNPKCLTWNRRALDLLPLCNGESTPEA